MTTPMTKNMKLALAALRDGSETPEDVSIWTGQRTNNARRTLDTLCEIGLARYHGADIYTNNEFAGPIDAEIRNGKSLCSAMRKVATEWNHTRQEFVRLAIDYGVKTSTANTAWNKYRAEAQIAA